MFKLGCSRKNTLTALNPYVVLWGWLFYFLIFQKLAALLSRQVIWDGMCALLLLSNETVL